MAAELLPNRLLDRLITASDVFRRMPLLSSSHPASSRRFPSRFSSLWAVSGSCLSNTND